MKREYKDLEDGLIEYLKKERMKRTELNKTTWYKLIKEFKQNRYKGRMELALPIFLSKVANIECVTFLLSDKTHRV